MKIKVKTVISENSDKFIGIYAPFGILELYPTSHPFYKKMSILMDKEVKDLVVDLSNITFDDNKIIVMAEPLNMNEEQTIKKFAQDIEEILDRYPKTKKFKSDYWRIVNDCKINNRFIPDYKSIESSLLKSHKNRLETLVTAEINIQEIDEKQEILESFQSYDKNLLYFIRDQGNCEDTELIDYIIEEKERICEIEIKSLNLDHRSIEFSKVNLVCGKRSTSFFISSITPNEADIKENQIYKDLLTEIGGEDCTINVTINPYRIGHGNTIESASSQDMKYLSMYFNDIMPNYAMQGYDDEAILPVIEFQIEHEDTSMYLDFEVEETWGIKM